MGKLSILWLLCVPMTSFARDPDVHIPNPPSVESKTAATPTPSAQPMSVGFAGVDFLFPTLRYDRVHLENTAWGASVQYIAYATNSATITGPSLAGSYTYFPWKPFDGPAFRATLGMLLLTATEVGGRSSTYGSLSAALNAGWRWRWERFAFAAGLGVQRFFNAHPNGIAEDFSGVLPSMEMSFGWIW